ncbi:cysteine hydrolase [Chloroflexia bacterium SDU3-3]|nr:cysteine hydrolase [Chloroflexia bacterium SDU3-3]
MDNERVSERPALLVMDMQRNIVSRLGDEALLARVSAAAAAARNIAIPVIYVAVRFREGYPEVSERNKMFGGIRQRGGGEDASATEIHPAVAPQPGDLVVEKRRVSAFAGSDLDVLLRAKGVDTLILCGIATSGVVLSTLRYAADLDYRLCVLADGCADGDPEVHRVLLEKVFPRQADVLSIDEWCASLV